MWLSNAHDPALSFGFDGSTHSQPIRFSPLIVGPPRRYEIDPHVFGNEAFDRTAHGTSAPTS